MVLSSHFQLVPILLRSVLLLCHLSAGKCEQWAMDLGFAADEEVNFYLTGKTAVWTFRTYLPNGYDGCDPQHP